MLSQNDAVHCPLIAPTSTDRILLAHGEGGRLMRRLIQEHILPAVGSEYLWAAGDSAILPRPPGNLAITTDSFVVSPLFFPGGDIGSLAVYGTVNDLAVSNVVPRWLSLSLILEEGLELDVLQRVLASVADAARRAGVQVVTGDTKVVPHGAVDKLFINTTGIGELVAPLQGAGQLEIGDELIVTGPIARHGIAVMVAREELALEPSPCSDSAPLTKVVAALRQAKMPVRAMRDATRGGVGAVLHEWAAASGHTLAIREEQLPVTNEVRGACELLGLDPIHVANEGTMLIAVPQEHAKVALTALKRVRESSGAARVGQVVPRQIAPVVIQRMTTVCVPLDEPSGAQLPRIC